METYFTCIIGILLVIAVVCVAIFMRGAYSHQNEKYAMASPPAEEWNRTYEMSGITSVESFQQTADSGYIIAGNTKLYAQRGCNISLLKIGPTGSEQWNRTFGRTFSNDRVKSVLQTSDGGYLITGSTSDCNDNKCPDDVWLIKINNEGIEQWNLTLGGIGDDEMVFVQQTADGGYILIEKTNLYTNILLIKVDSKGNMELYDTLEEIGVGRAYSVIQVPDGYIIEGQTGSYGAGDDDFWLVKTDTKGEEQWNNTYGGYSYYHANSVQQTRDGGYISAGTTNSFGCHQDFLLVKTDSNGTEQWYRTFGGGNAEFTPSVRLSPDGGYILGGMTFSFEDGDYWLIKTDAEGIEQWNRTFESRGFQQTPDGGYIIKGDFYDPSSNMVQKALIKIDSNGNEQWDIIIEGDRLESVLQTGDSGYILAGAKDSKLLLVKLMAERPAPTAQFTYDPGYPGANQNIIFNASASHDPYGNITYYQWDLGDGNYVNTTQRTVTHYYDEGGNYNVELTVTGSNDEVSSITWEIIVPVLTAQLKYDPGYPGANQTITFDASASHDPYGSITYYQWDLGDGSYVNTTQSTVTHSYDEGGNYSVGLTVTGSNDNVHSITREIIVQQLAPPIKIWDKTFGGQDDDRVYSLGYTSDGGYILAVSSRFFIDDEGWGMNATLVKTDANGNMQWQRTIGGTGFNEAHSAMQTSDGGYIVAGSTSSHYAGAYDFWLVKTDAEGTEQWDRTFGKDSQRDWTFSDDRAKSVQETSDGGYLIVGSTFSCKNGDCTDDVWLVKTDAEGIEQWNRTFGVVDYDKAYSLVHTSDSGYILAVSSKNYVRLIKTDANGNMQWEWTIGGNGFDEAYSVMQISDGGYIIAGNDCSLVKTDAEGIVQWKRTIDGPNEDNRPYSILQSPDGGYIIAGETGWAGTEFYDMWLVSTDQEGYVQWQTTFGGTDYEGARSVLLAPDGDLVVAGDKDLHSEQRTDFWLIKFGGIPAEPEGGDAPTDGEPV